VRYLIFAVFIAIAHAASAEERALKLIDRPLFVIVGQTLRVMVQTPPGTRALKVDVPRTLELYARRPVGPGEKVQRFYFRATTPGPAPVTFRGAGDELRVPLDVLSWAQVLEPRKFETYDLPRIWPIGRPYERLKPGRTLLTDAEIKAMREAPVPKRQRPHLARGKAMSVDQIYDWLPGSYVPRNCFVHNLHDRRGCPRCGLKIYQGRSPFYPWLLDPVKHPCKVGCPLCGEWFPTNDYAAGDMSTGDVVDDGYGADFNGARLSCVAYYNEWHYMRFYLPTVHALAYEYARTGDPELARKAAAGLLRIAEQYLNLAVNLNQRKSIVRSTLWRVPMGVLPRRKIRVHNTWMYVQHNWEVPRMLLIAKAYEYIFDALQEHDEELLAFCRSRHHPDIRTMEDFRRFIETGYFRTMAQCCLDKNIIGNLPQGQRALMELALVLGTPETRELVDWTFNRGGDMRFFLTNQYFKDGSAYESQGYNRGHVVNLQAIVDVMERLRAAQPEVFGPKKFPALAEDPKYRLLYDFPINFSLIGRTHAQTGDCGDVARTAPLGVHQCSDLSPAHYSAAYRLTRDPRYAQILHGPTGQLPDNVADPELRAAVKAAAAEHGWQVKQESNVTDGFGHAILRSGQGDARRAFWVRYGRSRSHAHNDMLTIGLEALKRKLLPEVGYPHSWQYRGVWEGNWAAHYCVRVRGEDKGTQRKGSLALFAVGDGVQVAAAHASPYLPDKAPRPYRVLADRVYERTLVLVDLSPEDFYAVDVFRVSSGNEHWWSFHGPRGQATWDGVKVKPQKAGTALGPDVPYGKPRKSDNGLEALAYMDQVQRGRTNGPWSLDCALEDYPDVHVRTTLLGPDGADLILAKGRPPGGGSPYELQWALLSRPGGTGFQPVKNELRTRFVQVLEAYEGKRVVDRVERVPVNAVNGESAWASALRACAPCSWRRART